MENHKCCYDLLGQTAGLNYDIGGGGPQEGISEILCILLVKVHRWPQLKQALAKDSV